MGGRGKKVHSIRVLTIVLVSYVLLRLNTLTNETLRVQGLLLFTVEAQSISIAVGKSPRWELEAVSLTSPRVRRIQ